MASRSDSNGRERLYKFKSRSGGVEERSKSKRLQDKKKREELTMKNRGVLNEIQQDGGDREAFKKQQAGKFLPFLEASKYLFSPANRE